MTRNPLESLGRPDLIVAGFQLWVHGYEFPNAQDYSDGNWLRVTAHAGASGAQVTASGALLETAGIGRFRKGLEAMLENLAGSATLDSYEPNINVVLTATDRAGHIGARIEITPDHMTQQHRFDFELDQSFLPAMIKQCDQVLARFPVRHSASRGV